MSYIFTKGATSQSIELYIVDSTNGTPETGVLWNTAGIDLKYRRKDAAVVSITEAALTSPALTDTWETGGFLEIGNGVYRLDLPDATLASAAGIDRVVVFGTVTGMVVLPVTIHLTDIDLNTALSASTIGTCTSVTSVAANGITATSMAADSINAASIKAAAIDNATFAADVGSTAHGTNIIALAVRKILEELNLDHLLKVDTTVAADGDLEAYVVAGTVIGHLLSTSADATLYKASTDSLQGVRDHIGNGTNLTEAGGDGDHLTAINLPNQTMDIVGSITGNLSGTVGSVTGAVGSVAGNVDGNVSGSVASVVGAVGSVTGAVGSVTGHTVQTGDNFAIVNGAAGLVAIDTIVDAIKVVTDNMSAAATTMITGTVSWDNTNATTTVIYSDDITEATADHYNGRLFVPTSGALVGQYTDITDYALDTGEGKFTVTAMTEAPADNTTFVIL